MNQEAAFIQAIREEPDDEAHVLIFADWLEERDDPRAKWIRDAQLRKWMGPDFVDPLPNLVDAFTKRRSITDTRHALVSLGAHAVPSLAELLRTHSSPRIRADAATVARELKSAAEPMAPELVDALTDPNQLVRTTSAKALLAIGPCEGLDLDKLRAALSSREQTVRDSIGRLLRKMESRSHVLSELTASLQHSEPHVRLEAIRNLLTLKSKEVIGILCRALQDPVADVAELAATHVRQLAKPSTKEIIEPVRAALRSEAATDRAKRQLLVAVGKLGRSGEPMVADLIELLDNPAIPIREMTAFALGRVAPDDPTVFTALTRTLEDEFPVVVARAMAALANRESLPESMADPLERAWNRLQTAQGRDGLDRGPALAVFGKLERARPSVLRLLRDAVATGGYFLRAPALRSLARIGPQAREALDDIVAACHEGGHREEAACALARIGPDGVEALAELLESEPPSTQYAGGYGINQLGEEGLAILPRIRAYCRTSNHRYALECCLRWMARVGDPVREVIPDFLPMLANPSANTPSEAIVETLEALAGSMEPHLPALVSILQEPAPEGVHAHTCRVLAATAQHSSEVAVPLLEALDSRHKRTDKENAEICRTVARGLGNLAESSSTIVSTLESLLEDDEPSTRSEAAHALGKLGSTESMTPLRHCCRDEDESVRANAVKALGNIGSTESVVLDTVLHLLGDSKPGVRREAVAALGRLAVTDERILQALDSAEQDSDSKTRTAAKRIGKRLRAKTS